MRVNPRITIWAVASAVIVGCFIPMTAMAQTAADTTAADSVVATPPTTTAPPPPPPPAQVSATSAAPPSNEAGMFSKGRRRVSGTIGWGSSLGDDYLLVGLGVGYFVSNGLGVGVDFEGWFIGDPRMYKISPRADYVLWKAQRMKPYAGVFYRYSFIAEGLDDQSSVGGRTGVFYKGARGGMAGAGVVYERYLDVPDAFDDDVLYPEVFIAISF
jgi:hypothetical protein